uniref:Far upstream element-binding protein 1-like isoform X2 n=1 Tax=Crassostrea virginica TaxID=6565 RepID=A0A8B8A988_CRAVI|nr:far upstream element-binding protein 1-like isoform X2 [Crassostrea virginica]XP_022288021.1 far upstream element-binding protein 1-like isoform X2 [Crassostrea virginica]XP_022288023.1 far upstream element-binding protein 1-like isoform X2 [Crassostrea virginica]XP_022288024.1 far upstream element-binding protein 1-like isoform X2 [Crassostrea virginica]
MTTCPWNCWQMVMACQTVSTPSEGSSGSVAACELTIQGDIRRANQTGGMGGDSGGGQTVVEVMVPGNKVGLVIGKGGETIRQLQRRGGVKMVIIQDDNIPSVHEKPLRISGDPHKCQGVKEMVLELLAKREMKGGAGGSGMGGPGGPGPHGGPVPRGPGYGGQYGGQYGVSGQQQGGAQHGSGRQGGWGGYTQ